MKITVKILSLFLGVMGISSASQAQFTISGEYRPRAEYRHGFKTLPVTDQGSAFFIDQRSRINFDYASKKYKLKFVLQDVRTWGSQSQLTTNDGGLTTLHEGWAELMLTDNFSTKIGRQEIIYDDHRIFGNVGWLQQARSHDAILLKYGESGVKVDVGLAFNQDGQQINTTFYSVGKSYKTFQYLWAHKDFDNIKVSLLFLNLGLQGGTPASFKTRFNQTLGGRLAYKKEALSVNAAVYSQTGDAQDGVTSIGGLLYSIDGKYRLNDRHDIGIGYEHLSGNDQVNPSTGQEAFNPYFGTNHKFNGFMDYFYVGNHGGSVGLNDLSFSYTGKFNEKTTLKAWVHLFSSDGEILDTDGTSGMDKSLGTEIDLVGSYKVNKEVSLSLGYSKMLGTDTMQALKGGDKDENSNWVWMMISFKPTFFTTKEKDD
jgi:hypothetical protein